MKNNRQKSCIAYCAVGLFILVSGWLLYSLSSRIDYHQTLCRNNVGYWKFKETVDEKGFKQFVFTKKGRYDILEFNQDGKLVPYRPGCSRWEGYWSVIEDSVLVLDGTKYTLRQIDDSTLLLTSEFDWKILHQ